MSGLSDALLLLSAAALGVFTGAMLTEGLLLVPWWRSLAPSSFLAWYAANDRLLMGFFGPLTSGTALLALAAALVSLGTGHPGRWLAALAALLVIAVVSTFFLYFRAANARFAEGALRPDEVPEALARWAAWHWLRTALSVAGLAAALLSMRGRG
jgi:hypothetical protein